MARGLEAIRSLLADTAPFAPVRTVLVATSAVRDAANGAEFRERVRSGTGQTIRILTGDEEANLIGRGTSPAIRRCRISEISMSSTSEAAASNAWRFSIAR